MPTALLDYFAALPDPRVTRTRLHALTDIVVIALCALLCDAEGWEDMVEFAQAKQSWLQERLPLANGIPCADTFRRVFARLDPQAFAAGFAAWVQSVQDALQTHTGGQIIAVDGKTLRHSFDTATQQSALHMVSAWASATRLVLAQVPVDAKSNEIKAVPDLLAVLDLHGCIVTADAMSCQRAIAAQIVTQGGDYVLAVKGNQAHLHTDVSLFFEHAHAHRFEDTPVVCHTEVAAGHGRLETRRCWQVDLAALDGRWQDVQQQWSGLTSLVMLQSERTVGGKTQSETRYYLSSLSGNAKSVLHAIRQHWGIENSVHWVLDVVMNEDACRIRKDNAPRNLATLRHIALNLLRQEPSKRSLKAKRKRAAWDNTFLDTLFAF